MNNIENNSASSSNLVVNYDEKIDTIECQGQNENV